MLTAARFGDWPVSSTASNDALDRLRSDIQSIASGQQRVEAHLTGVEAHLSELPVSVARAVLSAISASGSALDVTLAYGSEIASGSEIDEKKSGSSRASLQRRQRRASTWSPKRGTTVEDSRASSKRTVMELGEDDALAKHGQVHFATDHEQEANKLCLPDSMSTLGPRISHTEAIKPNASDELKVLESATTPSDSSSPQAPRVSLRRSVTAPEAPVAKVDSPRDSVASGMSPRSSVHSGTSRNNQRESRRPSLESEEFGHRRSQLEHLLPCRMEHLTRDGRSSSGIDRTSKDSADLNDKAVRAALPVSWPASLELRRGLRPKNALGHERLAKIFRESLQLTQNDFSDLLHKENAVSWRDRTALDPNSPLRMVHDVVGLFLLFYDLVVIPFMLAWSEPLQGFLRTMARCTLGFWTFDIFVSFVTGYYQRGELVMRSKDIAVHYVRTWFFPDLFIVSCDWAGMIMDQEGNADSIVISKVTRVGRLLRMLTLLRMVKLTKLSEVIVDRFLSDSWRMLVRVFSLLLSILWLNHIICCAWYAIGRSAPSDTGTRWVDTSIFFGNAEFNSYEDSGTVYQYATAYHWSASVSLGAGAVEGLSPLTTWERLFNIFCLLVGLIFGSYVVSTISASMINLQMLHQEHNQKLRTLRQFLRQHVVNPRLAVRVQKQVMERMADQKRLTDQDVPALKLLSVGLKSELKYDIVKGALLKHPLFLLWAQLDISTIRNICFQAVDMHFLSPKDDLFEPGSPANEAYLVVQGILHYIQRPGSSMVDGLQATNLVEGSWLCECALWVHWVHVGCVEASNPCELFALRAQEFHKVLSMHHLIREFAYRYGILYHSRVIAAVPPHAPWPSDVEVPFTEYADIAVALDEDISFVIGQVAIENLRQKQPALPQLSHRWMKQAHGLDELQAELEGGKCMVMQNSLGEVERVVALAAMHLERSDGNLLVQIGRVTDKGIRSHCVLPGRKLGKGDSPSDVLKLMLEEEMAELASGVLPLFTERDEQWKMSSTFGVHTRYLRTIQYAKLSPTHEQRLTNIRESAVSNATGRTRTERSNGELRSALDDSMRNLLKAAGISGPTEDSLPQYDIFMSGLDDRKVLYAWMPPDAFEVMSSPAGEKILHQWLNYVSGRLDTVTRGATQYFDERGVKRTSSDASSPHMQSHLSMNSSVGSVRSIQSIGAPDCLEAHISPPPGEPPGLLPDGALREAAEAPPGSLPAVMEEEQLERRRQGGARRLRPLITAPAARSAPSASSDAEAVNKSSSYKMMKSNSTRGRHDPEEEDCFFFEHGTAPAGGRPSTEVVQTADRGPLVELS